MSILLLFLSFFLLLDILHHWIDTDIKSFEQMTPKAQDQCEPLIAKRMHSQLKKTPRMRFGNSKNLP